MSEDYIALIPTDPIHVPSDDDLERALRYLESEGVIRKSQQGEWEGGTDITALIDDPNPREIDGESVLTRGGAQVVIEQWDHPFGHAGSNLEPIACVHCASELPFDEMLDAFEQARGTEALSDNNRTLVCFHCDKGNDALSHEYGTSAGFCRAAIRIHVSTGRQMTPRDDRVTQVGEALGVPVLLIAVLH